jgi:hypothetical protein
VGIWDFNITRLEEFFHGVNFKEMFVLREFVGESTFGLSEDWSLSSSLSSIELSSKDGNSIEGILVFLKLLDEKLVGFTSGDVKLDQFSSDGVESVVDPVEMIIRVLHFSFNPFSVASGLFGDLSISL